ncbi:MAG: DUF3343 domain-containing protein [Oscillospiraceae bacterium]|nr:DUF3343 domain-containing protein [Oscillospiraceae bacterium]
MEYYLLIARSVTHAQRMMRALQGCSIRAAMFRAPAGLTNRGCSYALRVRAERRQEAQDCLDRAGLRPTAVFKREGNRYVEVSV